MESLCVHHVCSETVNGEVIRLRPQTALVGTDGRKEGRTYEQSYRKEEVKEIARE